MIDWKRVHELRDEIGAEDFVDVAGMFLEEADQTVARLAAKLSAHEVEALLHFLKGSALNLGLRDLAAICQGGEKLAAAGSVSGFDFPQLFAIYASSKAAFIRGITKETVA